MNGEAGFQHFQSVIELNRNNFVWRLSLEQNNDSRYFR